MMNQAQFLGILRIVLPSIMAFVVAKGWVTDSMVADLTTAIVTIAAALWSGFANTQAATVAKMATMTGTVVSPSGDTITIVDPHLALVAAMNATPATGKI
jgi:hypothetical protein